MLDHPYAPFLYRVDKPGRYIGGEFGAIPPCEDARVTMALAFPDAYEIGMSHLGLSILYEVVNKLTWAAAERVFMPWPDMEAVLLEQNLPLLSLESGRPLNEFDVLGFSLQYELTFTNVLAMLDLGRIPRHAKNRTEADPLVIVGGPVALQSEPLAPFVDLVFLGDGESDLPRLLQIVATGKQTGLTRKQLISECARLSSVYAPFAHERVFDDASKRMVLSSDVPVAAMAKITRLDGSPTGAGPVPMVQAVFDRFSVEIARGCTEGCRFCQAGFTYRPVRERSVDDTFQAVKRATGCLGFDEVSLSALSSADHSRIQPIILGLGDAFTDEKVSFSVSSLRAYGLSDEMVEVLARLRATGVTLAPEAGSQRLRDAVNKNVTEDDLMSAAAGFFDHGFSRIKLYFMIGLPGETDEDLAEIIHLAVRLRSLGRRRLGRKKVDVVASVSTFVPKPFTPFEREPMISQQEIRRRQNLLQELAWKSRIELRTHDPRLSELEGVFCRGDISLSTVLEKAVDAGARFDGWGDMFAEEAWRSALKGIDVDSLLAGIPDEARLPFDHIDTGLSRAFLLRERDAARRADTTRPCGVFSNSETDTPVFVCHACGLRCVRGDLPVKTIRQKAVPPDEQTIPARRTSHPRPPERTVEGEPARLRFLLSIYGRQTFIGHLDTMRHLLRSLRRAGLEMHYTQGFHPKPQIEAPPPLPLGTAGLREPFDIWLLNPPSAEEILERLKTALPPDLSVVSVTPMHPGDTKVSRGFGAARYITLLKTTEEEARRAVARVLASNTIEVSRTRKRRTRTIEVRQYVLDATVLDAPPTDLRLPPSNDRVAVQMTLRVPGSGGTRPTEVLGPFLDAAGDNPWVVRTDWIPT